MVSILTPANPRSRLLPRYIISILATILALVLTLQMPEVENTAFYTFFVAAVAVSAYLAGWKAGLLSATIAVLFSLYFMIPPKSSMLIADPHHFARLLGFIATAFLITSLSAALSKSQLSSDNARRAVEELETAQRVAKIWKWEYDVSGRVYWEDILNKISVRRHQDLFKWLESVHPDDRTAAALKIKEALQTGEFEAQYRFRFNKDTDLLVLTRAVAQYKAGSVQKLSGFTMDLSTSEPLQPQTSSPMVR